MRSTPSSPVDATMVSAHLLPLLLAGLAWQPAHAAQLYKWVDSAGQVTYSSHPPPAGIRAEKVEAPPQPTAQEVRQTEERVKRIEEQAGKLEDQRRQKEAEEAEAARLPLRHTAHDFREFIKISCFIVEQHPYLVL